MAETIRWGILGTGNIAGAFAEGLKDAADASLVAVGSRAIDTADAFGDRFDIRRRHASYEALAGDPDVDAIYVASPHTLHRENSILCVEAGKAVLCEKPFAINRSQAEEAVALARDKGAFLMEAMWTRFLPVIVRVREWIADGRIGEVRMLTADFGFHAGLNPEARLFNLELGGGGLLDVGVYTVSLASMIFGGQPDTVASHPHIGETGVDEQAGIVFGYDGGQIALLCAVRVTTPQQADIVGTGGRIHIHSPWWRGTRATLVAGGQEEVEELAYRGNGYTHEAEEVGRCLREGKTESDTVPLDETLAVMDTLDRIRTQWGLKYPME